MSLKDLKLPTANIEIPGGAFTVRGLSPTEIEVLARNHKATLGALFERFMGKASTNSDMTAIIGAIVKDAPELMAHIICLAADEPDAIDSVLKIPVSIQLTALERIAAFTFTVEGDLGNLMATALKSLGGVNGLLGQVSTMLEKALKKS